MSTVQNNLEVSRYEMFVGGQLAGTAQYRMENGQLWLMSTSMLPLTEGRAVPEEFLLEVFNDLRRRRIEVLPFCATAREFMMANPRFIDLVPKTPPGHFPHLRETGIPAPHMGAATVPVSKLKHKRSEQKRAAAAVGAAVVPVAADDSPIAVYSAVAVAVPVAVAQ